MGEPSEVEGRISTGSLLLGLGRGLTLHIYNHYVCFQWLCYCSSGDRPSGPSTSLRVEGVRRSKQRLEKNKTRWSTGSRPFRSLVSPSQSCGFHEKPPAVLAALTRLHKGLLITPVEIFTNNQTGATGLEQEPSLCSRPDRSSAARKPRLGDSLRQQPPGDGGRISTFFRLFFSVRRQECLA